MSWRKAISRTRPNQRNQSLFSRSVAPRVKRSTVNHETHQDATEQISMHVRVLRYHEIRLGNIEKQLSNIARQLSNLGSPVSNKKNSSSTNVARNNNKNETVTQLQDILKNLAQEVSTSNKMIKDFIIGGNTHTHTPVASNSAIVSKVSNTSGNKKVSAMDSLKNISYKKVDVKSSPVEKHRSREYKLAKSRLEACGISATEERIQDMVLTMREEAGLVNDIVINRQEKIERDTHVLEETIVNIVDSSNNSDTEEQEEEKVESYDLAKSVNDGTVVLDIDVSNNEVASVNISSDEELETINVSTTEDIGYVPVHVVVGKKKKKKKSKKKNNAE